MPLSDDEIRQRARLWLADHGDEAVPKARDTVTAMQAAGDMDGADDWLRIIAAIEELRRSAQTRHTGRT
jgi:hypothetical protein